MKRLCAIFIALVLIASNTAAFAYEDTPVNLAINGKQVYFSAKPLIRDGVTYVDAKALSSKLSLTYKTFSPHESVIISNSRTSICFSPLNEFATVADLTGTSDKEFIFRILTAPPIYIGKTLYVAVRDIASVFGYPLGFNKDTNTVYLGYSPDMISAQTRERANSLSYYFQNQSEFNLPSFGSGYCWACSYAMLISNVKGERITPNDIAAVNIENGLSGEYCYHSKITERFGVSFTSALSENSPYYAGRDGNSGGTYIKNPMKDDNIVRAALREALTLHPEGVMVRYAAFPHTMLAVAYEGDIILFNDPAPSGSGTYSDAGRYQAVPFYQTCVGAKGFTLSDLTFIQALD